MIIERMKNEIPKKILDEDKVKWEEKFDKLMLQLFGKEYNGYIRLKPTYEFSVRKIKESIRKLLNEQ